MAKKTTKYGAWRAAETQEMRRELTRTCNKLYSDRIPFVLRYTVAGVRLLSTGEA